MIGLALLADLYGAGFVAVMAQVGQWGMALAVGGVVLFCGMGDVVHRADFASSSAWGGAVFGAYDSA